MYASHGDASTIARSTAAHASFAAAGSVLLDHRRLAHMTFDRRISGNCEVLVAPLVHENKGSMNPNGAGRSDTQPTKPIWIESESSC